MSESVKRSWIVDKNGNKIAPRTFTSQITTDDGTLLDQKLENDLLALKSETDEKLVEEAAARGKAIDTAYASSNGYTDQAIADLINGAPTTLDTLKEIADAMAENDDVVKALDAAIGTKADQAELDAHTGNETVHIVASERTLWNTVSDKVDKVEGKGLSTNDYTDEEKETVAGLVEDVEDLQNTIIRTTESSMPGSVDSALKLNEVKGGSEQFTTTSAQLFDKGTITSERYLHYQDGTELLNAEYFYSDYISVAQSTNYIISGTSSDIHVCIYDANKEYTSGTLSKTFSSTQDGYIRFSAVLADIDSIMVNAGDTELSYESYTGGVASPNPDYPQEIKTVKGKNLLDCSGLTESTVNGVTFTPVYDNNNNLLYINANGTATGTAIYVLNNTIELEDGNSYVLSGCPSGGSQTTYRLDIVNPGVASYVQDTGAGNSYTHAEENINLTVRIWIESGISFNNIRFYPMIRFASVVDSTYVPYGLLRLKTHGKNLLYYNNNYKYTISGVTVEAVGDGYSYKVYGTATGHIAIKVPIYIASKKVCTFSSDYETNSNSNISLYYTDAENTSKYVLPGNSIDLSINNITALVFYVASGATVDYVAKVQLEEGTVATDIEPYVESSVILSNSVELYGNDTEQDIIDVEAGVIRKRFAKVIFDGSEDETWSIELAGGLNRYIIATPKYVKGDVLTRLSNFICTHGIFGNGASDGIAFLHIPEQYAPRFYIYANNYASVDEWKTHLASSPITLYYELAEEEIIELPIEDKLALNTLKSFNGATYIESDSEIKAVFGVEYATNNVGDYALEAWSKTNNVESRINDTNVEEMKEDIEELQTTYGILETTDTYMPGSFEGGLKIDEIGGVCEQFTTTGKNLYDYDNVRQISAGTITFNSKKNGIINISTDSSVIVGFAAQGSSGAVSSIEGLPKVTEGKTYTFSYETDATNGDKICYVQFYAEDGSSVAMSDGAHWLNPIAASVTFTVPTGACAVNCNVVIDGIGASTTCNIYNIQLEEGSSVTEWEPYTGAAASPNPDYPQEIKTVKGKNLLDCRGLKEQTINGVTFTPVYDSNGNLLYIEANGTATVSEVAYFEIHNKIIPSGDYIANGCPTNSIDASIEYKKESVSGNIIGHDYGSEIEFNVDGKTSVFAYIRIPAGKNATNLRFYPMIRPAYVADSTYVPYGKLRVKTHGKNLLDTRSLVEKTVNGITYTPVYDVYGNLLYINANGTATAQANFVFTPNLEYGKEYILSGCPSGGSSSTYRIQFWRYNGSGTVADYGSEVQFVYSDSTKSGNIAICVFSGATVSNLRFYPMIREASVEDSTYEAYKESSVILSEPIELNSIGDVQDIIDVENGVIRRRFGKVIFDGTDDNIEWWVASVQITGRFICGIPSAKGNRTLLCTQARSRSGADMNMCYIDSNKNFYINTSFASLDEWKAHLVEKPMTIIYELAEEEVVELSATDKIALNSLSTYDGVTYLEFDCYLEPTFKGEYGTSKVGAYTLKTLANSNNANTFETEDIDFSTEF